MESLTQLLDMTVIKRSLNILKDEMDHIKTPELKVPVVVPAPEPPAFRSGPVSMPSPLTPIAASLRPRFVPLPTAPKSASLPPRVAILPTAPRGASLPPRFEMLLPVPFKDQMNEPEAALLIASTAASPAPVKSSPIVPPAASPAPVKSSPIVPPAASPAPVKSSPTLPNDSSHSPYPPIFGMDISKYLKPFHDFNLSDVRISKKWKKLGTASESVNGQVGLVTFTNDSFTVPAVIKQSNNAFMDNLMYEYKVGVFLNKYCSIFPCFVYTYGIYTQLTFPKNVELEGVPLLEEDVLKGDEINMKFACDNEYGLTNLSLLLQYVQNAVSFGDFGERASIYDIHCVLYQFYFALCVLYPTDRKGPNPYFEHNDLHNNNVLVKELRQEMLFTFKLEDRPPVQFKTKYLAKIIDYGRCSYYENEQNNSIVVMKEVCSKKSACSVMNTGYSDCGANKGFERIYRNVVPELRQIELQHHNYYPDSQIASFYSALPKNYPNQNKESEETMFENRDYTDKSKITHINRFSLKNEYKNYKLLLDELNKIIILHNPHKLYGVCPTLVIDGVHEMVFEPNGFYIDVPYEL